jgi:release factor glutamine methyltransferase
VNDLRNDAATVTVRELIDRTTAVLGARHEARWLVEVATALDGAELDAALDEPVTARMANHLDAMLARCRTGEPLQYVLGRWGFRRLDLAVDRRVLIPRPETELVAEIAIDLARSFEPTRQVADLGTGSGAIGLAMATELPLDGTTVWITDESDDALAVARANLAGTGRAAKNVRVGSGSWFEALPHGERFDVVVSNPPYVADRSPLLEDAVLAWEPGEALFAGPDGLDDIKLIIAGAGDRLVPGGWLVLEIGSDQGRSVHELLDVARFVEVEIRPDLRGHDRIAVGRRPG